MMDIYSELVGLIDELHSAQIEHALCGGLAVALHGFVRFTKDIDLLIRREALPKVLAVAEQRGFRFPATPMFFAVNTPNETAIHRVTKIESTEFLTLDLVLVTAVLEDVWATREEYTWWDRTFQAVSSTGLAKMKRLANRDQDRVDLKNLGFEVGEPNKNS